MKMEHTECSETSEYKIQTPGNYPEENIRHTEHGESFKSRRFFLFARPLQKEQIECSETSARLLVYTAYDDGTDSVQKHQYIKFRSRAITRKKEYNNIQTVYVSLKFINNVLGTDYRIVTGFLTEEHE